jgi:hypothetical protein
MRECFPQGGVAASREGATLLRYARFLGLALAAVLLLAVAVAVWRLDRVVQARALETASRTQNFVLRVRACRLSAPRPMPTWQACEDRVRAAERLSH